MKQDYQQMRVLELSTQVYASGQLFEEDLKLLSRQGVRSIVNNRPDGETTGQPASADLARVAAELGMTYVHFPIESGRVSEDTARAFAKACDGLERPIIAFSRTGARSIRLWETAEALDLLW